MTRRSFTLLAALSALAAPAAAQTPAPAYHWNTLVLQYAAPATILKGQRWDANAALPQGVKRIFALQNNHSLLIQATPDGYKRIRAILAPLDAAAPKPLPK